MRYVEKGKPEDQTAEFYLAIGKDSVTLCADVSGSQLRIITLRRGDRALRYAGLRGDLGFAEDARGRITVDE